MRGCVIENHADDESWVIAGERMGSADQAVPALEFDVYDLQVPRGYEQWFEMADNSPNTVVWLGSRSSHDHGAGALVGTAPRAGFSAGATPLPWEAGGVALYRLMDLIQPAELSDDQRTHFMTRIPAYLEEQVRGLKLWPRVEWTLAGARVSAATLHFAGAWLAITDDLPESFVVVIGAGFSPDGLELQTTRGEPYGLDFSAPITIGQMNKQPTRMISSSARPHPDLQRLLQ